MLTRGWHKTAKVGLSFGEAVAFVSGEPHTVTPISACPVLLEICNSLNDANFWSSNTERSKHLLPLVSLVANSKSAEAEKGVKIKIVEETLEDIKYCVTLTSKG